MWNENIFSVTDETRSNKKTNIHQIDGSKKNRQQNSENGSKTKSLTSNEQQEANRKDNKRVFNVSDSVTKHLNGYAIGGKIGNCNAHPRPSHDARVRCVVDHIEPVNGINHIILSFMLELMTSHQVKRLRILQN